MFCQGERKYKLALGRGSTALGLSPLLAAARLTTTRTPPHASRDQFPHRPARNTTTAGRRPGCRQPCTPGPRATPGRPHAPPARTHLPGLHRNSQARTAGPASPAPSNWQARAAERRTTAVPPCRAAAPSASVLSQLPAVGRHEQKSAEPPLSQNAPRPPQRACASLAPSNRQAEATEGGAIAGPGSQSPNTRSAPPSPPLGGAERDAARSGSPARSAFGWWGRGLRCGN